MKSHLFQLLTHHLVSHLVSSSSEMFCHLFPLGNSAPTQVLSMQGSPVPPHPFHTTLRTRTHFSSLLSFPGTVGRWQPYAYSPPQTSPGHIAATQLHHSTVVSRQAQISVTCSTSQLVEQDPALHWQPPNLPRDSPSRLLLFRS